MSIKVIQQKDIRAAAEAAAAADQAEARAAAAPTPTSAHEGDVLDHS